MQKLLLGEGGHVPQRFYVLARIADINTDSPGLLDLVRRLKAARVSTAVRDSPVLHAKIYMADRSMAVITSANCSDGGFSENLEVAVSIMEPEGVQQVVSVLKDIASKTTLVSISDLEHFVTKQRPLLVEQTPPQVPPAVIPVWRRPSRPRQSSSVEPLPAPLTKGAIQSRAVALLDVIKWVDASLHAAQADI